MSDSCNHDCGQCSQTCADRKEKPDFSVPLHEGSHVKKVIGVVSGKGGVGKSMVTGLLSVLMNRKGYLSAVLDSDITGPSIPKMFGIKGKATGCEDGIFPAETETGIKVMSINLLLENDTDPVLWRGPILAGTVKQFWSDVLWDDVDFMFVDMPPGTGDVALTVFQSLPIDGLIIVASPQEMVSMIVAKAVKMAEMMNVPILGLVENMGYIECPDCGKKIRLFGESHIDSIAEKHGLSVLAQIPVQPKLAAWCDAGDIESFEGDWLDKTAEKIESLLKGER